MSTIYSVLSVQVGYTVYESLPDIMPMPFRYEEIFSRSDDGILIMHRRERGLIGMNVERVYLASVLHQSIMRKHMRCIRRPQSYIFITLYLQEQVVLWIGVRRRYGICRPKPQVDVRFSYDVIWHWEMALQIFWARYLLSFDEYADIRLDTIRNDHLC